MKDTIAFLSQAAREAMAKFNLRHRFPLFQEKLKALMQSAPFQGSVMLLIFVGFIQTCVESQMQPAPESRLGKAFKTLDVSLVIVFFCELLLNILANWFYGFFCNGYYLFDAGTFLLYLL